MPVTSYFFTHSYHYFGHPFVSKMSKQPSPYDILGAISFIQGSLMLAAAVLAAFWSTTCKVLSNDCFISNSSGLFVSIALVKHG